jgi:uncharacterized protein
MILVDANILIYASSQRSPQHKRALAWLNEQLNGTGRVGIPWVCAVAFIRVTTNPRVVPNVISAVSAWEQVRGWFSCPSAWIPQPTEHHLDILGELLSLPGMVGNLVTDAHLAALAIEHGLTLCSNDGDFARFKQLKWMNPLA